MICDLRSAICDLPVGVAIDTESELLAEVRGVRTGPRDRGRDARVRVGARVDEHTKRLDGIDGRLQVVKEGMTWLRQQVLTLLDNEAP